MQKRSLIRLSGPHSTSNDISHAFDIDGNVLPVLDDVHFSVKPGEFVALLGPSGCGKSTLLRLVAGLEAPRSGALREDGDSVTGPFPSRVVVFQDPTLFPWRTVWNNVALGLEAQGVLKSQRQRVDAALDLVGLSQFRNAYPHQLSGGMAQRVALARALVNDPNILILDEPLGKLDSLTRITMQAELVSLWQRKGFTTLLVTHDVEEALFLANRVIVFSDRPARIKADIAVDRPYPRHRGDPKSGGAAPQHLRFARIGCDMVSVINSSIRKVPALDAVPVPYECARGLASEFAARAAQHDREASFPFENFKELAEAGLLALTVPTALGGLGAGRSIPRGFSVSSARPIHRRRWCCRCTTSSIWRWRAAHAGRGICRAIGEGSGRRCRADQCPAGRA